MTGNVNLEFADTVADKDLDVLTSLMQEDVCWSLTLDGCLLASFDVCLLINLYTLDMTLPSLLPHCWFCIRERAPSP